MNVMIQLYRTIYIICSTNDNDVYMYIYKDDRTGTGILQNYVSTVAADALDSSIGVASAAMLLTM